MPSIRRNRSGNWEVRVSLGASGEAQRTFDGGLPEREARKLAEAFERRVRGEAGGAAMDGGGMRLADYLEEYIENVGALTASPASIPTYRTYVRRYIAPHIGRVRLYELTARQVGRMLAKLAAGGEAGGLGLSDSTVRCVHAFLEAALDQAVRYGMIAANPMDDVARPKASPREAVPLDEEDIMRIDELIDARRDVAAIAARLALATGLRRGEACGLVWRNLDAASRSLHVSTEIVEGTGGRLVRKEPKSKSGIRTLRLDDSTWDWLVEWKDEQAAMIAEAGGRQTPFTPVVSLDGSVTAPGAVSRGFKRLVAEAGIERGCRFHDLRHTHATHLIRQGVDIKTLQRRLGHSSAAITLGTYGHVLPGADDQAAEATAEVLRRARRGGGETVGKT
ncbi:MAG: site-specific integrase [Kiritimatiellae bacterium]|nr:site-specific integrase [Kiritimatiellia bacterium]